MTTTQTKSPSLILCIVMDIIGYSSFGIPLLGEFFDLAWAPLSAFIFYNMFGGKMGAFGSSISFIEELLPFTDFIPTFTIAWFLRSRAMQKEKQQQLVVINR